MIFWNYNLKLFRSLWGGCKPIGEALDESTQKMHTEEQVINSIHLPII